MDKYPCTCGGENPNCFRCDGTGMVSTPYLPTRSDGKVHVDKDHPPKESPQSDTDKMHFPSDRNGSGEHTKYQCRHCLDTYRSLDAFLLHLSEDHKITGRKPSKPRKSRAEKAERRKQQKLTKKAQPRSARKPQPSQPAKGSESSTTPTKAKDPIRNDQLSSALAEAFPHIAQPTPPTNSRAKSDARQARPSNSNSKKKRINKRNAQRAVKTKNEPRSKLLPGYDNRSSGSHEREMDATYRAGSFARDHGQFGSAPSYDRMDDESMP